MKKNGYLTWGVINFFSPFIWLLLGFVFCWMLIIILDFFNIQSQNFIIVSVLLVTIICLASDLCGFIVGLRKKYLPCWLLSIIGLILCLASIFGAIYFGARF